MYWTGVRICIWWCVKIGVVGVMRDGCENVCVVVYLKM